MEPKLAQVRKLPLLPLRGLLVYPSMVLHLDVGRDKSVKALEQAMLEDQMLLLCSQSEVSVEDPAQEDIYPVGTVAMVRQMLRLPNSTIRVLVEGMTRAEIIEYVPNDDFYEVKVHLIEEQSGTEHETEAFRRSVLSKFESYVSLSKKVTAETLASVTDITEPGRFADMVASHLPLKLKDKQYLLEISNVRDRLEALLELLENESEVLELERKIHSQVKKRIEKTQKEYYLREQMKAIQKELGDKEGRVGEVEELREQLKSLEAPEKVLEKLSKEIDRLEKIPPSSAEGAVVRNYIDWVMQIPWGTRTEDDLDLHKAESILEADHYGLDKPKERVLEYLAVQQLVKQLKGPILCMVGPPGVGKTSLARSIAKSLGRKFVRISLGGVRDEAEIRGHRRTYVGAMPGRIIQALKTAGSMNPVVLLDEIDKMGSDMRGDPSAAMLEVLDPEQNNTFSDHFIELPVDLSQVMFVTTANAVHNIPRPLLDRMEYIPLSGYTELEKLEIAKRHLFEKQMRDHGLQEEHLQLDDDVIRRLIREYTREAGVRQLEQRLAALCRKAAKMIVSKSEEKVRITASDVEEFLGVPRYRYGQSEQEHQVGMVTGLAWTEVGGDTLTIEVTVVPGTGKLLLTGKLGDVMKESAQAAFSYIRSKADVWELEPSFHEKLDIHIHVPEGAIPKDGPSAGIAMATALVSALTKRYVSKDVAMTGEITLRGRVLPIGGLKEKSLAAHRAGIQKVLFPYDNVRDLDDIPESIRQELVFVPVRHMDEVLAHALLDQ
ncbi:endopeptidase La [Paenibacillus agilis]|uniref:Lon protease n=1 Tax=Paenibacillus agilis TaxID=3020863 RepID=A0A559IHS1_9BACL|nr:endopeptidase La [Paenibacillus agilis]TVX87229.1 endopeptidase La [Paenibacillus agilis]